DILYKPIAVHDRDTMGKIPYLNCVPFYDRFENKPFRLIPLAPRPMGKLAEQGQIDGGPLSLLDYWRVEKDFDLLDYGIAVRNLARSVVLYSNYPWLELEGKRLGITSETSTSIELLKVLLAHKYGVAAKLERLHPIFQASEAAHFDAVLVIGDEALIRAKAGLANFRYVFDLGKEWHDWTGLPFVFAVWAVRKSVNTEKKQALIDQLERAALDADQRHPHFGAWHGKRLGMTPAEVQVYLDGFVFRLGEKEKAAMAKFRGLLAETKTKVFAE
ncbi:MAG: menaquinone biosynthesis protein, partial [candidate division KSB1 bacterium]|nr:menaquinone biosynthesis protein [candidate division KSB1 bacterium]